MKKFTTTTGKRTPQVKAKVVSMRKKGESWASIASKLEISPRTARRIFDEKMGEGAHFESRLSGKGGRTRKAEATTEEG